jgi:hypothetical protein
MYPEDFEIYLRHNPTDVDKQTAFRLWVNNAKNFTKSGKPRFVAKVVKPLRKKRVPQYLFAVFSLMNNTPFSLEITDCFKRSSDLIDVLELDPRNLCDATAYWSHVFAEHFYKLLAVHLWETLSLGFRLSVCLITHHRHQWLLKHADNTNLTQSLNLFPWFQSHALHARIEYLTRLEILPA